MKTLHCFYLRKPRGTNNYDAQYIGIKYKGNDKETEVTWDKTYGTVRYLNVKKDKYAN